MPGYEQGYEVTEHLWSHQNWSCLACLPPAYLHQPVVAGIKGQQLQTLAVHTGFPRSSQINHTSQTAPLQPCNYTVPSAVTDAFSLQSLQVKPQKYIKLMINPHTPISCTITSYGFIPTCQATFTPSYLPAVDPHLRQHFAFTALSYIHLPHPHRPKPSWPSLGTAWRVAQRDLVSSWSLRGSMPVQPSGEP
jgi:hypothetical protein